MKKIIYISSILLVMMLSSNLVFSQIQITSTTNASSITNCDGSATVSANGTAGPFTYQWSNGSTSTTATQLCSGVYHVTVTNAYECETVLSVTISVDCDEDYDFVIGSNVTNTCLGSSNGSINIIPISESRLRLQYSYQWSNGSSSSSQSNLASGYYCVTVTSSYNGQLKCQQVECFTVALYWPQITANNITTSCHGQSTGGIDINVSGATAPYTYQWSNGTTSKDLINVAAGTYTVTATDATGCSWAETYSVPSYSEIVINYSTEVTCSGYSIGEIDVSVSGGKPPYTYQWSNGSTASDLTGLSSGTYTLTVTDDNNCTEIQNITISTIATIEEADPGDCRLVNTFCNGQQVATTNYGTYYANNPFDCRYLNEYCQYNNQLFATNVAMPGTQVVYYGAACVADFVCSDGTVYSTHNGISGDFYDSGITQSGQLYCVYVQYCHYPSLNYTDYWSIIPQQITSSSPIYAYPNACPNAQFPFYQEYYCNGDFFASTCLAGPSSPPLSDSMKIDDLSIPNHLLIESITGNPVDDIKSYLDGTTTNIMTINSISSNDVDNIEVFPNPFDNEINIKISSDIREVINVRLSDALGKTLISRNYELTEGQQIIKIATDSNLPKGVYFLTIEYPNGKKESIKIMH